MTEIPKVLNLTRNLYIAYNQHNTINSSSAKTLMVSFIGMRTIEVPIQPTVNVSLKPDVELLDEVIITGYGVTRKAALRRRMMSIRLKHLKVLFLGYK